MTLNIMETLQHFKTILHCRYDETELENLPGVVYFRILGTVQK
jgi:hypothetical protein